MRGWEGIPATLSLDSFPDPDPDSTRPRSRPRPTCRPRLRPKLKSRWTGGSGHKTIGHAWELKNSQNYIIALYYSESRNRSVESRTGMRHSFKTKAHQSQSIDGGQEVPLPVDAAQLPLALVDPLGQCGELPSACWRGSGPGGRGPCASGGLG